MQLIRRMQEEVRAGRPVVLCIITETSGSVPREAGTKMLVFPDGKTEGSIGGGELESLAVLEALTAFNNHKPRILIYQPEGEEKIVKVYLEPAFPESRIIILGAGHIGRAAAELAGWLGHHVWLWDDRPEVLAELNPEIPCLVIGCPVEELHQQIDFDQYSRVVLTTRSSELDIKILPQIIKAQPAYLGVLGSKKRWGAVQEGLRVAGIKDEEMVNIHSPIGLKIGAESPQEIAVSILAEIISEVHNG